MKNIENYLQDESIYDSSFDDENFEFLGDEIEKEIIL